MRPLPSANYPPENAPGGFHHDRPYTVYHSSGEVQTGPSNPVTDRIISLNEFATGEAIAKATYTASEAVWFFAVVLHDGSQHVYEGTPSQAANGMGGARVRGCKALNKWVEELSRVTRRQGDVPSVADGGHANDEDGESVATPPLPSPDEDGESVATPPIPPQKEEVPPSGAVFHELADVMHSWTYTQGDGTSATRAELTEAIAQVHTMFETMGVRAPGAPEGHTREKQRHLENLKKRPHEE